ncbi:ABC transporter substrate-binding protein [Corynebacterium frankenforstense]
MSSLRISRRSFLAAAAVVAGSSALAACSGGDSPETGAGASRTVADVDGNEVQVPENPERVVALSEPTLDAVLALGITPAGTISGRGQETVPPYLADKAGDVPILGTVSELNFEAIGAVKPDLILVDGTAVTKDPNAVAALQKIAPTVNTGRAGGDWRDSLTLVAAAVGQPEAEGKVRADHDARVADLKERLAKYSDQTFSVVRWQGNAPALILKELPAGRVLDELGLERPPKQDRTGGGHSEPVAMENLADIDADYIFFGSLGGSSVGNQNAGGKADVEGSRTALQEAESAPGFTELNAYKQGHIIPVDGGVWTSTGGPLQIQRILDDVQDALIENA